MEWPASGDMADMTEEESMGTSEAEARMLCGHISVASFPSIQTLLSLLRTQGVGSEEVAWGLG